ncbi:MAG TPA: hypothetical protein VF783_22295, partial [Terriglobales bacterium]
MLFFVHDLEPGLFVGVSCRVKARSCQPAPVRGALSATLHLKLIRLSPLLVLLPWPAIAANFPE